MNIFYKSIIISLLLFSSLYGGTINVAVAANVSYAIEEIQKEFEKIYPQTKVRVILGSSGKLTAQIKNGAPYDVFLSANMKYPQALFDEKLAVSKPYVYAYGSLALLSTKKRDFSDSLDLLLHANINKIAVANPKTAPYGMASFEAMKNADVLEMVENKFVYGESVAQTLSFAIVAADIGLVAKSMLLSPKMKKFKEGKNWVEVDNSLFTPIQQGIVILSKGMNKQGVKNFYDFVLSQKAKEILAHYGYIVL